MVNARIYNFRELRGGRVFSTTQTGTRFVNGGTQKSLEEFLCNNLFQVYSIQRINDQVIFTLGDRLDTGTIDSIYIEGDLVLFLTSNNSRISSNNAVKYVAPVEVKTPKKAYVKKSERFKAIEAQILTSFNGRSIRLEETLKKTASKLGLQGFLVKFLIEWNNEKKTIWSDTKETQTDIGKRRSLGDIYMLCKYYFPECTLTEVLELLYVNLNDAIENGYRTCVCQQIKKRVWYVDSEKDNTILQPTGKDEFGNIYSYYTENL